MRLGLFLSAQHPAGVRPADAVREHLEQVAVARDLGFSSVWAGQHFLSDPFQMFQTVPFLARMAAEAGEMTIGPGIMLLTLLNPVEVAENAATLSAISEGRYVLGVGLGGFGEATGRTPGQQARFASHTAPVSTAAELGAAGLLALAGVVLTVAAAARRPAAPGRRALRLVLGVELVAVAVHALFYNALFEDPYAWVLASLGVLL